MFGKKKNDKNQTREYVNGVPQKVPDLEIPTPTPDGGVSVRQAEEVPPVEGQPQIVADCFICFDYGFYADNVGVWHKCPRCDAWKTGEEDQVAETEPQLKPLHKWRTCENCEHKQQVHNNKKVYVCESCKSKQQVEK